MIGGGEQRSEREGIREWQREQEARLRDDAKHKVAEGGHNRQALDGTEDMKSTLEKQENYGHENHHHPQAKNGDRMTASDLEKVDKWRWQAAVQVCIHKDREHRLTYTQSCIGLGSGRSDQFMLRVLLVS